MDHATVPSTNNVFGSLFSLNSSTVSASKSESSRWRQLDVRSMASNMASKDGFNSVLQVSAEDAVAVVEVLDRTLDLPDLHPTQSKRCSIALRKLCGRYGILPTSYTLTDSLEKTSEFPRASGGFADVWQGQHKGRLVAIKELKISSADDPARVQKRFCKEALVWKRLSHPNVLPFLGVAYSPSKFWMVSIWMTHGDIMAYIRSNPEANRLLLLSDVASGLNYLHKNDLVHGDMKGQNILINNDYRACLADFGLMAMLPESLTANATSTAPSGGTWRWMAPELLVPEEYGFTRCIPTKESDVYALGMVIYEVMTGNIPYYQTRHIAVLIRDVVAGVRPERPTEYVATGLSDLWELVELCWRQQRTERPSVRLILDHLNNVTRYWDPSSPSTPAPSLNKESDSDTSSTFTDDEDPSPTEVNDSTIRTTKPSLSYGAPKRRVVSRKDTIKAPTSSTDGVTNTTNRSKVISQDPPVNHASTYQTKSDYPTNSSYTYSPPPTISPPTLGLERAISFKSLRIPLTEGSWEGIEHPMNKPVKTANQISPQIPTHSSHVGEFASSNLPIRPLNHRESSSIHQRATSLLVRYKRSNNLEDLEEAINHYRKALASRPPGHRCRSDSLSGLALAMVERSRRHRQLEDLERAIVYYRDALALRPPGDQSRSDSLNGLAASLVDRFKWCHQLRDLDEAITRHREALALRPPGNRYRHYSLDGLACSLVDRFRQRHQMGDLDEAIGYHRDALSIHPPGHQLRSGSLNSLALALSERFRQGHQLQDLNESITHYYEALVLHPPGHQYRSASLNGLALALSERFRRSQTLKDLDDATVYSREALHLRPPGHTARCYSLNTVTRVIHDRFEQSREPKDLDEAMAYSREALDHVPPLHPARCISLNNVARALHYRFERFQKLEDLEEAMIHSREALALNPPGHLDWFDSLIDLAVAIIAQSKRTGRKGDLPQVVRLLSDADAAITPNALVHIQRTLTSIRQMIRGVSISSNP